MQDPLRDETSDGTAPADTRLEIHPSSSEFLDDAAGLLAQRQAAHRVDEPALPAARGAGVGRALGATVRQPRGTPVVVTD